jgi:hypothetical protein
MVSDSSSSALPPSGPWSGYYLYGYAGRKHYMKLSLAFTLDGNIHGDGIDDVAPFAIDGFFDSATNQARWTKAYVGRHRVEYCGFFDRRTICGDWTLPGVTGAFWIWPNTLSESEKEAAREELDQPVEAMEAVLTSHRIGH